MNKKGFTLTELLAVITILAIILLIVFPVTKNAINKSRENAYEVQVNQIVEQTHRWAADNNNLLPDIDSKQTYYVTLSELINGGYIKNSEDGKLYDPRDNSEMNGCVVIKYSSNYNQYIYYYNEVCDNYYTDAPTITFINNNEDYNGWFNKNFFVNIEVTNAEGYDYCISNEACSPKTYYQGTDGYAQITEQGNNYICVQASNNVGTSETCSDLYKLDTSSPIINVSNIDVNLVVGDRITISDYFNVEFSSFSGEGDIACNYRDDWDVYQVGFEEYAEFFSSGVYTVTCTATGVNGKESSKSIDVTVVEYMLLAPTLSIENDVLYITASESGGSNIHYANIIIDDTNVGSFELDEFTRSLEYDLSYLENGEHIIEVYVSTEGVDGTIYSDSSKITYTKSDTMLEIICDGGCSCDGGIYTSVQSGTTWSNWSYNEYTVLENVDGYVYFRYSDCCDPSYLLDESGNKVLYDSLVVPGKYYYSGNDNNCGCEDSDDNGICDDEETCTDINSNGVCDSEEGCEDINNDGKCDCNNITGEWCDGLGDTESNDCYYECTEDCSANHGSEEYCSTECTRICN